MLGRLRHIRTLFGGRPGFPAEAVDAFAEVIPIEVGDQIGGGGKHRWIAPRRIYHVVADTLAPSAETSLFLGLLTGAELVFKLPSAGAPTFESLAGRVSEVVGKPVGLDREWDQDKWDAADTVVVFGSDETVAHFRALAQPWQTFVAYGHKISAARVGAENVAEPVWAERAVADLEAYRQTGCLSPQLHLVPDEASARTWVENLTARLREREDHMPEPSFEEAAAVRMAQDRCRLAGNVVHVGDRCRWSVAECSPGGWFVGPGYGFVQVVIAPDLRPVFESSQGHWSALGVSAGAQAEVESMRTELAWFGFSRICWMGRMQEPGLGWRHDGGMRLAALGRWLTGEF